MNASDFVAGEILAVETADGSLDITGGAGTDSVTYTGNTSLTGTLVSIESIVADGILSMTEAVENALTQNISGTGSVEVTMTSGGSIDASNIGVDLSLIGGGAGNINVTNLSTDLNASDLAVGEILNAETADGSLNITGGSDTGDSVTYTVNTTLTTGVLSSIENIQTDATLTTDVIDIVGINVTGLQVNALDLDSVLNADFTNITPTTLNVDWTGTQTYVGNLNNVDSLTISSGEMTVADTIINGVVTTGAGDVTVTIAGNSAIDVTSINVSGTETVEFTATSNFTGDFVDSDAVVITGGGTVVSLLGSVIDGKIFALSGNGDLTINAIAGGDTISLSGLTSTLTGTLTVNDASGSDTITGTSLADVINLINGGTDNVNAGSGADTINIDASNIALGTVNGEAGTDTFNITEAGVYTGILNGGSENDTLEISAAGVDISGLTLTSIESLVITNPGSITLSDDQVSAIGASNISGTGTITVEIDSNSALDMTPMGVTTTNVQFTEDSTFTGTFDSGSAVTVDATKTITADYSKLTGFQIDGAGSVHVEIASISANANLTTITGVATQTAEFVEDIASFTGNLGSVATSLSTGVDITATGAANLGSANITVDIGATLTLTNVAGLGSGTMSVNGTLTATAATLTTQTTSGTGTVSVLDLDATPTADLSALGTTTVTALYDTTSATSFSGDLGTAVVSISDGVVMKADYTSVTNETINKIGGAGTGILNIQVESGDTSADLTTVGGDANKRAEFIFSQTFTGVLGAVAIIVLSGVNLVASTADLGSSDITIDSGATLTINSAATMTTGSLTANGILNLDAADAISHIVGGTGALNILNLQDTTSADLTTITESALSTKTVEWSSGTGTFTGDLDDFTLSISAGVMSANGTIVDGKTIDGAGTLNITGTGDGNLDLGNVSSLITAAITDGVTTLSNIGVNVDATSSSSVLTYVIQDITNIEIKTGSSGNDIINATALSDTNVVLVVGDDNATVNLIAGDVDASASSGIITVNASTGSNDIATGSGNDIIDAGTGVDVINAGNGTNSITGGAGADNQTGGTGVDTFIIASAGDETGDAINGLGASDSVELQGTGSYDLTGALTNIEELDVSAISAQTVKIDASTADTDLTSITGNASNADIIQMDVATDIDLSNITTISNIDHFEYNITTGSSIIGTGSLDEFTIDFTQLGNIKTLDGTADGLLDTVYLSGATTASIDDLEFTNITTLDFATNNVDTTTTTLTIDNADITSWTDATTNILNIEINGSQENTINYFDGATLFTLDTTVDNSFTIGAITMNVV